VIELAHLARRALDDDIAQCDLTITADGDLHALGSLAAHAQNGGAVKLFHLGDGDRQDRPQGALKN
jgi:hypothetical protein